MASWSFRSTKASWLLSSLKEPMASWRFFCKRSTKASWLPEAETSRGAHGILDPKPFKAFNVRQTFSKNFQKLDPVLHALCGRCHCRWTSTHICTRIWGAVIGARAFAQRLRRSRGFGRGLLSVLLPPQSPLLPLTASLLLLLLFPILSGFPPGVCTLVLGITPALVQLASWVKAAASLIVSYDSTFLAEPQVQHLMFRRRLPDELLLLGLSSSSTSMTGPSAPAARDQKPHSNEKEATQPHALQGYTDSLLQQELQQYHPLAGVKKSAIQTTNLCEPSA